MSNLAPIVRHMLICEDVRTHPDSPKKVNVFGLLSTIRAAEYETYPLCLPNLCIYLQITGGRGSGAGQIVAVQADSEQFVFASLAHPLVLGNNPLAVRGLVFRIQDCIFPQPGLYWIQFRFDDRTIAEQPLVLK